jgi:hypothetical protein
MDLLKSMNAWTVRKKIEQRFKRLEPALRKSITFDQGKENSEHKQLSENTAIVVYFCHPYSPGSKGRGKYELSDTGYALSSRGFQGTDVAGCIKHCEITQ